MAKSTKKVLILVNHVFLPEDPSQPGWRESTTTKKYDGEIDGRRQRVECHPELAEFLQGRKQAEILDD